MLIIFGIHARSVAVAVDGILAFKKMRAVNEPSPVRTVELGGKRVSRVIGSF